MTETTDIEALVTWLRTEAALWETEDEDREAGVYSPTAQKLSETADALEAQQAVVVAARAVLDRLLKGQWQGDWRPVRYLELALAALDAPPDEKYEDEKAAHLATINEKPDAPLEGEG